MFPRTEILTFDIVNIFYSSAASAINHCGILLFAVIIIIVLTFQIVMKFI